MSVLAPWAAQTNEQKLHNYRPSCIYYNYSFDQKVGHMQFLMITIVMICIDSKKLSEFDLFK